MIGDVLKYLVLALRFIHGKVRLLFDAANLFHRARSFVQERKNLPVHLVDSLTASPECAMCCFAGHDSLL